MTPSPLFSIVIIACLGSQTKPEACEGVEIRVYAVDGLQIRLHREDIERVQHPLCPLQRTTLCDRIMMAVGMEENV